MSICVLNLLVPSTMCSRQDYLTTEILINTIFLLYCFQSDDRFVGLFINLTENVVSSLWQFEVFFLMQTYR